VYRTHWACFALVSFVCLSVTDITCAGETGKSWQFTIDQLEWQSGGSHEDAVRWDVTAWVGNEVNRLWFLDEGRDERGLDTENRGELYWAHLLPEWLPQWGYIAAGIRYDEGATPSRGYLGLGLIGGEGAFRYEALGYAGDYGHIGGRIKANYDWGLPGRFTLSGRIVGEVWNDDHDRVRKGSGPILAGTGVRLRYQGWRNVAPYVGYEWEWLMDDTAEQADDRGEDPHRDQWVAGLRVWF
jgi:copper resistance protein B